MANADIDRRVRRARGAVQKHNMQQVVVKVPRASQLRRGLR